MDAPLSIALILIVVLVLGLAMADRGNAGKVLLIAFIAFIAFIFLFLAALVFSYRQASSATIDQVAHVAAAHEQMRASHEPTVPSDTAAPAWLEADEYFLIADVYPSVDAAARGLGARLAGRLSEVVPNGEPPEVINVTDIQNVDRQAASEFARTLGEAYPAASVYLPPNRAQRSEVSHVVEIELALVSYLRRTLPGSEIEQFEGELSAIAIGPRGQSTNATARYVDKPWVSRFNEFISQTPQRKFILAQSLTPATSGNEAIRLATEHAAQELARVTTLPSHALWRSHDHQDTGVQIKRALLSEKLIVDQFVQRFERPSGDVYRALLLIDASPEAIQRIERRLGARWTEARTSWATLIGSAVLLVLITCGLYFMLNAATRGYYSGVLRTFGVLILLMGGFAIVMLA